MDYGRDKGCFLASPGGYIPAKLLIDHPFFSETYFHQNIKSISLNKNFILQQKV